MSKTGKKLKSVNRDSIDLTYNEIYDVFIDSDGYEFIIDDVGNKRYAFVDNDNENYYELVDDVVATTNDIRDTNETKPKFKVGDKVKVVNVEQISQWTKDIEVGYVGVVVDVNVNVEDTPYKVKLDKCHYDWWFTNECIELVNDDTNETKLKFKVGDKVKVVDIGYISQYIDNVNVGVIVRIDNNDNITPYLVKFEDSDVRDDWWFTDKCIELIVDDNDVIENNTTEKTSIVSDGGSSSYYAQQIPKGMLERFNTTGTIEAKDIIRLFLGNDFNMGNIFKAYCRITSLRQGKGKAGIDEEYDLTKAKYFTEDELNYHLENKDV